MDALLNWVTETAGIVGAWIQTDEVLFWISWLGTAVLFAGAGYWAWRLVRTVRAFGHRDAVEIVSGRQPTRAATIKKRIKRAKAFANSTFRSLALQVSTLVFAGIVIPGAIVAVIAINQDWFLPGTPVLSVGDQPIQEIRASYGEVVVFVIDQALRGALSDAFEVFGFSLSPVTNNTENHLFSGLVLFYRFLSGLVAAAFIYVVISVLKSRPTLKAHITRLEEDLRKAG